MSAALTHLFDVLDSRPQEPDAAVEWLVTSKFDPQPDRPLMGALDKEELFIFVFKVVKLVGCYQGRVVTSNGKEELKEGTKWKFGCSHRGGAAPTSVKLVARESKKVRCSWSSVFYYNSRRFEWNTDHVDACEPEDTTVQEMPEGTKKKMVLDATQRIKANPGTGHSSHANSVTQELEKVGVLGSGKAAPDKLAASVVKEARSLAFGDVKEAFSLDAYLKELDRLGCQYELKEVDVIGDTIVDAVTYNDPELLGADPSQYTLFMADVSFHFVDKKCGYSKTSLFSATDFAHHVHVLAVTMISHEDQATFEFELSTYIANVDPTLPDRPSVFIVDGDKVRIAAIKKLLPLAKIYLCVWHKKENLQQHFGAALRKTNVTIPQLKAVIKLFSLMLGTKFTLGGDKEELISKVAQLAEIEVKRGTEEQQPSMDVSELGQEAVDSLKELDEESMHAFTEQYVESVMQLGTGEEEEVS
jgi:hypothetical protein